MQPEIFVVAVIVAVVEVPELVVKVEEVPDDGDDQVIVAPSQNVLRIVPVKVITDDLDEEFSERKTIN